MLKRIRQVGNSCALILDKPILEMMGLAVGSEVRVRLHGETLSISPVDLFPGECKELESISEELQDLESEQRNTASLSALFSLRQQLHGAERDLTVPYQKVIGSLDKSGCVYAIVGDIAASVHGEPRMVTSIEAILHVSHRSKSKKFGNLLRDLREAGFDLDPDSAVEEWKRAGTLETKNGEMSVRLMAASDPLQRSACIRAQPTKILGRPAQIASVEDCLLQRVQSWRLRDVPVALEVVKRHSTTLDRSYLMRGIRILYRKNSAVKERMAALFDNERELPPGVREEQSRDSAMSAES